MSKMKTGLLALVILFALALSACGDHTATTAPAATTAAANQPAATTGSGLPGITGASSIALPAALKDQASAYTSSVKNGKFDAFKVSDQPAKVETSLTEAFKKAGWEDKSSVYAASASALKAQGVFVLLFQKGNSVASVVGYPGSMVAPLGAGVGANETFYMVVSGNA